MILRLISPTRNIVELVWKATGRLYTKGRIIRLEELGQTLVIRLVIRL